MLLGMMLQNRSGHKWRILDSKREPLHPAVNGTLAVPDQEPVKVPLFFSEMDLAEHFPNVSSHSYGMELELQQEIQKNR